VSLLLATYLLANSHGRAARGGQAPITHFEVLWILIPSGGVFEEVEADGQVTGHCHEAAAYLFESRMQLKLAYNGFLFEI
jgi:hypothetical protein